MLFVVEFVLDVEFGEGFLGSESVWMFGFKYDVLDIDISVIEFLFSVVLGIL